MRFAICCMSLLATSFALVGCGQSGDLILPKDINGDKRPKYLLYKYSDQDNQAKQASDQVQSRASSEPVDTTPNAQ
ncbi:LPS translocon maturation chaperone LptM [Acinetobacter gerneri]|uniref:Lipoprotein n=1 Tax=Acinetobacter gerneri DSM 14967 = CIP 107464 = MTCC 9824 TaxID=1120926 RepID=N8ZPI1_9GAMM|nr:lipoprotein [Acinetobacter gerneri]ENV33420.1 hypothetical protein F960_02453 [Acinetobacter gerneri DSM 14967 = CIP 107464 = MTCC 9824]EPR85544.1 hypothetical protein L289_0037 [Acinetobacter gerneri DSM 14967 = CIP 107464 = MTCC 9824]